MKVPLEFHEHHPFSFLPFLQPCLEFCVNLAFSLPSNASLATTNEKLLMLSLNLLKNIILCKEYASPTNIGKGYGEYWVLSNQTVALQHVASN